MAETAHYGSVGLSAVCRALSGARALLLSGADRAALSRLRVDPRLAGTLSGGDRASVCHAPHVLGHPHTVYPVFDRRQAVRTQSLGSECAVPAGERLFDGFCLQAVGACVARVVYAHDQHTSK